MPETRLLDDLRREALGATRGLFEGEQALVAALAGISEERSSAAEAYAAIVRSLAVALSARDGYTGKRSDTVRELAVTVGRSLGLDGRVLAEVEACALLHDVGKIGVLDAILYKPGPLDPEEWAATRSTRSSRTGRTAAPFRSPLRWQSSSAAPGRSSIPCSTRTTSRATRRRSTCSNYSG